VNVKGWSVRLIAVLVVAVGIGVVLPYVFGAEPAAPAAPAAPAPGPAAPAAPAPGPAAPAAPAAPAGAPEAAPAAPTGTETAVAGPSGETVKVPRETMMDQLNKGGTIGWIIMALSPVALALILEHVVNLRRDKMVPPELLSELQDYFNEEQYEEALELCNVERNFLTDVVRAGLLRLEHGWDAMQQAMSSAAEEAYTNYQLRISWLSLIGTIAPMLGLLGTVQGMIGAFGKIAYMTVVKPSVLAYNINVALVTTFQGLSVAIPVMCAYQYICNRIVSNVLEAGTAVSDLMDKFRPKK
jgi:biopolymer transport protein ExbB